MARRSPSQKHGKSKSAAVVNPKKIQADHATFTKAERIETLLRRPEGASIDEMMKATGWQQHSLRGYMSGTIVKRKGLTIASEKSGDERRYRIIETGAAS